MTRSGGSAMMYGVLYQLLGTARWAGKIDLAASTDGDEWTDARIVIEPSGGGGDNQIHSSYHRIVEQWKSKRDRGPWPLRKVITDVLPDLYRAVDLAPEKLNTEFRFVTEGHRGRWDATERFFEELRAIPLPDDPFAMLDDKESIKILGNEEFTRLGFFRYIQEQLRTHPDIAREAETECARKLWHLLGCLSIESRTAEQLIREVDAYLRPLVDYREHVEAKRRELCAALLELASDGHATFTPRELLAKVSLDHTSFCNWSRARDSLRKNVRDTLDSRWHYCADEDVRPPLCPPEESFVCALTGESGQGKTWRLASLAANVFADGSLAVAVSATGDAHRDLENVANVVWRDGFDRESATDLDLIARKRRDFLPELPMPWLTICIDDVQSTAEARGLVDQSWASWGIRLVLTLPPPIAQALTTQYGQRVAVIEVEDFSVLELRQYLDVNGHDWGMLPVDVRTILCRPLFAKLYCDIAEGENWRPTNEYALFSRYWRRMRDDRNQADYPGDMEAMERLASTFLNDNVVYPWPPSECVRCGVSSDVQTRLESVGWLRRLENIGVEVPHDRLLNWAIAEAIVAKRVWRVLSTEDVANRVSEFFDPVTPRESGRMLAYVPMDVYWIMSEPGRAIAADLPAVMKALEDRASFLQLESLYRTTLPTLGPRIIEPMVARIRARVAEDAPPDTRTLYSGLLSDAVIEIGRRHPRVAVEWGRRMFEDECESIREAGLYVLKRFPNAAALDRLWGVHKINYDMSQRKDVEHRWVGHDRTYAAMKACVRANPEWLKRRILESPEGSEPFSELAFLVANLRGDVGATLWSQVKSALFLKVPRDKPRCLVACIHRYTDRTEIARLEAWLEHDGDLTRETALAALVDLSPDGALAALGRCKEETLYFTRNWWRPGLLLRLPSETREQIRQIIVGSATARWQAALVYQDDPNQMDVATLNLLLDELEALARETKGRCEEGKKGGLFVPLEMLADVTRVDLLAQFEARAGTALERELADLACAWGGLTLCVDHELRDATRILVKMAGEGLTSVVNTQLSSTSKFACRDGIELSLIRPDSETRRLLIGITVSSDRWDEKDSLPLLQAKAAVALAALGENRSVVGAIVRWGLVLQELLDMREGQPPMTDNDLTDAIAGLEDPADKTRMNAVAALSVSGRSDFAPRIRQILRDADPESELARAAVMTLGQFGDTHPDTMTLFERQLGVPGCAYAASLALLRNGKRESLMILENELKQHGIASGFSAGDLLAVHLGMRQETRKTVAEVFWQSIEEGNGPFLGMIPSLQCLLEIDSPKVREFLVEEAHAPDQSVHVAGYKADAIRALAKFDRDLAFRAAETALRTDRNDIGLYPALLMEIDEARALPILFETCARNPSTFLEWAIGRALRRASDQTTVHVALDRMMCDESAETRIVGVKLGGWQQPTVFGNRIRQIAVTDPDTDVRRAAERSATLVERQQFALELLEALEKTHDSRSWSYLDAAIELCDPWLLTTQGDPLCLWSRLSAKPPGFKWRAVSRVEQRIKHVKDEADKADRQRNR